jgi:hypothetical protein
MWRPVVVQTFGAVPPYHIEESGNLTQFPELDLALLARHEVALEHLVVLSVEHPKGICSRVMVRGGEHQLATPLSFRTFRRARIP